MAVNRAKQIFQFYVRLIINLVILFFIIKLFLFSFGFAYKVFANEPYQPDSVKTVVIHINKGTSTMNIGETLEEKQVIESRYVFAVRAKFSKYSGKLKSGTYEVTPAMSIDQILGILSQEDKEKKEES